MKAAANLLKRIVDNHLILGKKENVLLENFPNMEITISNYFNPSNPRIPLSDKQYKNDKDYIYSIAQF